jgi:predicted nucleic acid-binding protein
MRARIYVETSVISYLTARPHRDVIVAGQQQLTRDWWENGARHHDLYSSDVVWEEAAQGDQAAAAKRLGFLENLPEIPVTEATIELAELLLQAGALPAVAYADALHVAVCATNEMDILVTWNCKHIANVTMFDVIDRVCRQAGYKPPRICTPVELWGA